MEKRTHRDIPPDDDMRGRVKIAGAVGVSALALMGAHVVDQARAEVQSEPIAQVMSAEDVHGNRADVTTPSSVFLSAGEESGLDNERDFLAEVLPAGKQVQDGEKNEKSPELENNYQEPAPWWPVGVKENWLQIQATAKEYDLDPYLVATIVAEESGGQNISNTSGATGLMQIMPSTAQEVARLRHRAYYNMHDIAQNLDYGCWLIHYIDQKYISGQGVELETDFGIAMLAVGYGDGEGALQVWAQNGYQLQHLSDQARHVTPLWSDMYHSKDKPKSAVYTKQRGSK